MVTLRKMKLSDAKDYLRCHQDKEAKKNFHSVPRTIKTARKELRNNLKKKTCFAIEVKGKFAGFITLELNKIPRYKHSAIIGYGLHKDFRGKGIATEAVKKITSYGFNKLKLKRISGYCRSFNKASAKVLKKAGYKHEGTLRKNKFVKGRYLDDMVWAKVR